MFMMILVGCIWKCGIILRPTDPDFCECQIRSFHSLEENTLDVISYGSSHCWSSFDSVYYEEETGLKTYNYGCNWQNLNTTWLFFYDSLKTQSPKKVFIEVGVADYSGYDRDVDGEIYYTREISNFDKKKEYLQKCFGPVKDNYERYIAYYVPFVLSHENWENLERKSFHYSSNSTGGLTESNGYNPRNEVREIDIPFDTYQKDLPDECVEMLDNIVETCKEKEIELIFFTTPSDEGYPYDDFMNDYADKNGVVYISFYEHFKDAGLDEKLDFSDGGHFNTEGARKATEYLLKME